MISIEMDLEDSASPEYKRSVDEIVASSKKMERAVENATRKSGKAIDEFVRKANKISEVSKKMGKRMLMGAGIIGGTLTALTIPAIRFQKSMAMVSTMLSDDVSTSFNEVDKYMEGFREDIKKLAVDTGESTSVLSEGLYDILSASVAPEKAFEILKTGAEAAIGGITDSNIAISALLTAMKAYGDQVKDVADVSDLMFGIVKKGRLTYEELATQLGTVASVAAAAGVKIEELGAFIATATRGGLDAARSVTSLGQALISTFARPTQDMIEAAKQIGLELTPTTLKTLGFTEVLKKLASAPKELIPQIIRSKEAMVGFSIVLQDIKGYLENHEALLNRGGEAHEAHTKMVNITNRRLKKLRETFVDLLINTMEPALPIIDKYAKKFGHLAERFDRFSESTKKFVIQAGFTTTAVLAVGGAVAIFTSVFAKMLTVVIANPFIAIGVAITAAVAAIIIYRKQILKFINEHKTLSKVIDVVIGTIDWLAKKGFPSLGRGIVKAGRKIKDFTGWVRDNVGALIDLAKETAKNSKLGRALIWLGDKFRDLMKRFLEWQAVKQFWGLVKKLGLGVKDFIKRIVGEVDEAMDIVEKRGRNIRIKATFGFDLSMEEPLKDWLRRVEKGPVIVGGHAVVAKNALKEGAEYAKDIEDALASLGKPLPIDEQLQKIGDSLKKQFRTPEEIYSDAMKKYQKLLQAGVIGQETFARASGKAWKSYVSAALKDVNKDLREGNDWLAEWGIDLDQIKKNTDASKKAMERMKQEAKSVIESTRTPLERFNAEVKRLSKLNMAGLIDTDTFDRAIDQAQKNLEGFKDNTKDQFADLKYAVEGWGRGFEDVIVQATHTGKLQFKDLVRSIMDDILRLTIRRTITERLFGGFNKWLTGGKKNGPGFGDLIGLAGGLFGLGGGMTTTEKGMSMFKTAAISGVPTVPFQHGGIVTRPTPALLAENHRPEAVIPLGQDKTLPVKMKSGEGKQPVAVTVVNIIEPDEVVMAALAKDPNIIVNPIMSKMRESGPFLREMKRG